MVNGCLHLLAVIIGKLYMYLHTNIIVVNVFVYTCSCVFHQYCQWIQHTYVVIYHGVLIMLKTVLKEGLKEINCLKRVLYPWDLENSTVVINLIAYLS